MRRAAELGLVAICSAALAAFGMHVLLTGAQRGAPASSDAQLEELVEQVDGALRRLESLENARAAEDGAVSIAPDSDAARRSRSELERVSELAKRVAALEAKGRPSKSSTTPSGKEQFLRTHTSAEASARVRKASEVILDRSSSAEQKIEAQQLLRRTANAYTPAMIQSLLQIAQSHANAELRAKVWTFFDGATTSDLLVAPLLHALRHDSSDAVRAEAAETLGNYTERPEVRQALTWHATNDKSKQVRDKARRSVPGPWRSVRGR